jgi:hypothetical protein
VKLAQLQDDALEHPDDETHLPVIQSDSYESSDEHSDVEMDDSASFQWRAGVTDAVYAPEEREDSDTEEDEGMEGSGAK